MRLLLAAALLSTGAAQAPAPVTNVTATSSRRNKWVTGAMDIFWDPPGYSVSNYVVTVAPLDVTVDFNAADDLDYYGFVLDRGVPAHAVAVDPAAGRLVLTVTGDSPSILGRGRAAYAYRKLPDVDMIVEARLDGSAIFPAHAATPSGGAVGPIASVGVLVFDAGKNAQLFTCGLVMRTDASGANPSYAIEFVDDLGVTHAKADNQVSGAPWPMSGVHVRVFRVATGRWSCEARVGTPGGTAGVWNASDTTRLASVSERNMSSYLPGDLWFGVAASAQFGTSGAVLQAYVESFRMTAVVPAAAPPTIFSTPDVCIATAVPVPRTAQVAGTITTASFSGLSAAFPYHVTIQAVAQGSGAVSAPSRSVVGGYFWARPMPPRAASLGLWLDARSLTTSPLSRWADASGNGHHMTQGISNARPAVRVGDYISPSTVAFARNPVQFMTSGADAIDLGITGEFTMYAQYRGATSVPQLLAGRGPLTTDIMSPSAPGWVAMVFNDIFRPWPGYIGLRISDAMGNQGGSRVDHHINNNNQIYWSHDTAIFSVASNEGNVGISNMTAGSPGYAGRLPRGMNVTACRNAPCTSGRPGAGIAAAVGQTVNASVAVLWNDALEATRESGVVPAIVQRSPSAAVDMSFRLGAANTGVEAGAQAFQGDVAQILIYKERHSAQMRATVVDWMARAAFLDLCPFNITTPGTSQSGPCGSGNWNSWCTQWCLGQHEQFVGQAGDHWCSNGRWQRAPLVCRRRCADRPSPRYTAACDRTWFELTWGAGADPFILRYFVTSPALRIHLATAYWQWNMTAGVLMVDTNSTDACERVSPANTNYVMHSERWNLYVPPGIGITAATNVSFLTADTQAGLVVRQIDSNNMYRVLVGPRIGVQIVRVLGGGQRILATAPIAANLTIAVNQWYELQAVATGPWIGVIINNVTYLNVSDRSGPSWGSTGFAAQAGSRAMFRSLTVRSGCDVGMVARYMMAGMKVEWQCKPGYEPVGNATLTCRADGTWSSEPLGCKSAPPIIPANQRFNVSERSPNNTLVGVMQAAPASLDQTLVFELERQIPLNRTPAFNVVGCSGAIRVADPVQMDYNAINEFILEIRVLPDGERLSSALANVTVKIENILDIPEAYPTFLDVPEHYTGPLNGSVLVSNPDRLPLNFSITGGDVEGIFSIDPARGNLSVRAPGASFAQQQQYALLVNVFCAAADITLTTLVTIDVRDVNSRPVMQDAILFALDNTAVQGAFVGVVAATDVDTVPGWDTVSMNITQNSFYNPENDPLLAGVPLFGIDNVTGALTFNRNASVPALDPVYICYARECRKEFVIEVQACDQGWPRLCTTALARVVLIASNNSLSQSRINSMNGPNALATEGGEDVIFGGRNLPVGSPITASYGRVNGTRFPATCSVSDAETIACKTSPGWGSNLVWELSVRGVVIPALFPLISSYASPVVVSVLVNAAGFTTAGSAVAEVRITGSNFGPANAPVVIRVGQSGEFAVIPTAVSHTLIRGTLTPGCGANLPVTITIGDVPASIPAQEVITYPRPTLSTMSFESARPAATAQAMDPRGGDVVVLNGTNFGPLARALQPILLTVTYSAVSPRGPITRTATCTRSAANAHTQARCTTEAGVGTGFRWRLEVCGQASDDSSFVTSYARPTITAVTGQGAARASTEGGQVVRIQGTGFGPLTTPENPWSVPVVRYGTPGVLQYQAESCSVTSTEPATITCVTAEGTGRGHWWSVDLAGSQSEVFAANTSYAAPSISFFSGNAAFAADTRGVEFVRITGINFGSSPALLNVSYTDMVLQPRERDGVIPGAPAGTIVYRPVGCNISIPHRELMCPVAEGAGTGLTWEVIVDGQPSTTPTTSYAPPSITSVVPVNGEATVTTDGGAEAWVLGENFGPAGLIQSVRYGPSGSEFAVANFTFESHLRLRVRLRPGIGRGLRFSITTADQSSDLSAPSLDYDTPRPVSITPSWGDTESDPQRPLIVTVTGYEFGLLSPSVDVGIAFGNVEDGTLRPLIPIISRIPSYADVTSPSWRAPRSPVLQTVSFAVPEGLGQGRAVRVVPYNRGSVPDAATLANLPLQTLPNGAAAAFTYSTASIAYIEVDTLNTPEDIAAAQGLLPEMVDPTTARKLRIHGRSFGPAPAVLGDQVQRVIDVSVTPGAELWEQAGIAVESWSHRMIVAYTVHPAAVLRVRVVSINATGSTVQQMSNTFSYSNVSPKILRIIGQSANFGTAGGESLTVEVRGLDSASTRVLNMTVGGRRCALLGPSGEVPDDAPTSILVAQHPIPQPGDIYVITCRMPQGQGRSVPLVMVRDGVYSNSDVTIDYAPPEIYLVGVYVDGSVTPRAVDPTNPIVLPTTGARIRIEGVNLGVCPTIAFNISTGFLTPVEACQDVAGPDGTIVTVQRTDLVPFRTHRIIDLIAPDGEGAGLSEFPGLGWTMFVTAGANQTSNIVRLRFAAPTVATVEPSLWPSRGGGQIVIQGTNFGVSTPTVQLGSANRPWLLCQNVVRLSHYNVSCMVPEGSGGSLQVNVIVAGQMGAGASLSYDAPTIQSISIVPLRASSVFTPGHSALTLATTRSEITAALQAASPNDTLTLASMNDRAVLAAAPAGHVNAVVFTGTNFGPREAVNCVFASYPATATLRASNMRCNGIEEFLGEGEIPSSYVLVWDHELVAVVVPSGAGPRTLHMKAANQGLDPVVFYPNFQYTTPVLNASLGAAFRPFRTDGGDVARLQGVHLPPPPFLNGSSFGPVAPPFPVTDVLPFTSRSTVQLRVNFMSKCMAPHPVLDENGAAPSALSGCRTGAVVGPNLGLQEHVTNAASAAALDASGQFADYISVTIPPGLGTNKTLSISLIAGGDVLYTSAPVMVRYAAPIIDLVTPRPVPDNGKGGQTILISGANFGRVQDLAFFAPEELVLEGFVAGAACQVVDRVVRGENTLLQCKLPQRLLAGSSNITVRVAGQDGFAPAGDVERSVFVGCSPGFYAHAGEVCMPCPRGAECAGFVVDGSIQIERMRNGSSSGVVKIGNVMYDEGGMHTYPVPLAGFYDLNGTMASACPAGARVPGRDICIVGCMPVDACIGANLCAEPYASAAPVYRCAVCAKGFFRAGSDCIKCPDRPALVFVGIIAAFVVILMIGYFLHKYNFNIAVISLGVDYFQVVAVFASAKVDWPQTLRRLYQVLSSFNLNLDLMAPECLIPDVSFTTKFVGIVTIPFAVYGLTGIAYGMLLGWKYYVLGRRGRRELHSHVTSMVSAALIVLFLAYLNVTRTIFSLFVCLPPTPPDGRTYLTSGTVEPCGEPGGVQDRLMGYAIVVLLFYTIAYPAGLIFLFTKFRALIMEDQLLRARGIGADPITNPHAMWLRASVARTYYQFKPDTYFWTLAILTRKFCIAFAALVFAANTGFQLAATLLVLFLAYAAQVRWRPFMPPAEYDDVIAHHLAMSETNAVHRQLRASLKLVEQYGRKRMHTNSTRTQTKTALFASAAARFFMNYNTVEAFLLFSACIVCLSGLMFITLRQDDSYYGPSRDGVTALVIISILLATLYYVAVVIVDITTQARGNTAFVDTCFQRITGQKALPRGKSSAMLRQSAEPVQEEVVANPLFAVDALGKGNASTLDEALLSSDKPPDSRVWAMFRAQYLDMQASLQSSASALREARVQLARNRDLSSSSDAGTPKAAVSAARDKKRAARSTYGPTLIGNDGTVTTSSSGPGTPLAAPAASPADTGAGPGIEMVSLLPPVAPPPPPPPPPAPTPLSRTVSGKKDGSGAASFAPVPMNAAAGAAGSPDSLESFATVPMQVRRQLRAAGDARELLRQASLRGGGSRRHLTPK